MSQTTPQTFGAVRSRIHHLLGHPALTQDDIAAIEEALPPASLAIAQELLFILEAKIDAEEQLASIHVL